MSSAPAPVAYSYVRFSHPDQAKGDSLRRQTKDTEAWCERNGAALDASTTLHDLGKSAFSKRRRPDAEGPMAAFIEAEDLVNPDRRALASFQALIKARRVPRGSYLIIENLDRLSRDDVVPATHLLTGILLAGVRIVQLRPAEQVLTAKSDGYAIMMAVMELSRGHGESALKSERLGAAWGNKKAQARADRSVQTTKAPAWLRVVGRRKEGRLMVGGRFELVPDRAAAVKRIFALAAAGYGAAGTVKKLTAEGVPAFGGSGHWSRSYITDILGDRRALGEFQPRKLNGEPDGPPVAGYYPAAVGEAEWQAARAGAALRRRRTGRGVRWTAEADELVRALGVTKAAKELGRTRASVRSRRSALARQGGKAPGPQRDRLVNVFSGLLRDARDGGAYYVATRSSRLYGTSWRVLLNVASAEGRAPARSFPFRPFHDEVLRLLREVDPAEVQGRDAAPDEAQALKGELATVRASIAALSADLDAHGDSPALYARLRAKEARQAELVGLLAEAERKSAVPLGAAWDDAHTVIDALAAAPDQDDAHVRLRAALKRVVESVWLLPVPLGRGRLCAVQIWFAGGERQRSYVVLHRPPCSGGRNGGSTPGRTWAHSFAELAVPGGLDLRRRADAAKLEKALAGLGVAGWIGR